MDLFCQKIYGQQIAVSKPKCDPYAESRPTYQEEIYLDLDFGWGVGGQLNIINANNVKYMTTLVIVYHW